MPSEGPLVIGAGLMRTGTMSSKLALQQLLGGRCYHMDVVMQERRPDLRLWCRAANEGLTRQLADRLLGDFTACVDVPACLFYGELARIYPDAKVVLTVRDPAAWVASLRATVLPSADFVTTLSAPVRWLLGLDCVLEFRKTLIQGRLGVRCDMTDAELQAAFERHNSAVRAAVPPERLLEFRVSEGWGPLCGFLGVPQPDGPFPRSNDTAEFQTATRLMILVLTTVDYGVTALGTLGAGLAALWLCRRSLS